MSTEQLAPVTDENRRTYGGSGRHTIPSVTGTNGIRVKGTEHDVRKVLRRAGYGQPLPFDCLTVDVDYIGRHQFRGQPNEVAMSCDMCVSRLAL